MLIAVMSRVAKKGAIFCKQGEIDAPGIDPDAIDMRGLRCSDSNALEHFAVKVECIPMEVAQSFNRPVGKAMHHIQSDHIAIKSANDGSAAFCAIIECQ